MIALTDDQTRYLAGLLATRLGDLTAEIRRAPRFSTFKAALRAEAESLRALAADPSWIPLDTKTLLNGILTNRMTTLTGQVRRCRNAVFKDRLRYEIALAGSIVDRLGHGGTRTDFLIPA